MINKKYYYSFCIFFIGFLTVVRNAYTADAPSFEDQIQQAQAEAIASWQASGERGLSQEELPNNPALVSQNPPPPPKVPLSKDNWVRPNPWAANKVNPWDNSRPKPTVPAVNTAPAPGLLIRPPNIFIPITPPSSSTNSSAPSTSP